MANLSKASNVVQEKYILYDVTGFTQKWHSIPVATNFIAEVSLVGGALAWGVLIASCTANLNVHEISYWQTRTAAQK